MKYIPAFFAGMLFSLITFSQQDFIEFKLSNKVIILSFIDHSDNFDDESGFDIMPHTFLTISTG